jgi:hypothetical protein
MDNFRKWNPKRGSTGNGCCTRFNPIYSRVASCCETLRDEMRDETARPWSRLASPVLRDIRDQTCSVPTYDVRYRTCLSPETLRVPTTSANFSHETMQDSSLARSLVSQGWSREKSRSRKNPIETLRDPTLIYLHP